MSEPTDIPDFRTLAADPEIAPLLDFEPAPRKVERPDGWTPELQRELIARIAATGSPGRAVDQMDKNLSGAKHLYRTEGADSFRQAWKAAIDLAAERKRIERAAVPPRPVEVPGIERPRKSAPVAAEPLPGQVLNERGQWEDEDSLLRRAEDARDSMTNKLLHARRLYLAEICDCPGKRAAFEILTELPIDWDRARKLKPQRDEPWRKPNMRRPDMLLTAENGWLGDVAHGPDKKAELQKDMDEYLKEMGMPPVDWGAEFPSPAGQGLGVGTPTNDAPPPDGWAILNPKRLGIRTL